jgi:hypothetical protein
MTPCCALPRAELVTLRGRLARGLSSPEKRSRFASVREVLAMSNRARSEVDRTASSKAREGFASALLARVDLSLVAEGASSNRAHSKSTIDGQALPNLSGAARERALRLARRLASSHSD